jgi:subtilisin family serine protease
LQNRIRLSRKANEELYAAQVGTDDLGPFSSVPPRNKLEGAGEGTFPAQGYYTSQMSQAEIDALLAKTGPLTPEELVLKTDLLLGRIRPQLYDVAKPKYTQAEIDAIFAKTDLTPEEQAIKADMMSRGHGQPPKVLPGWSAPVEPAAPPLNPVVPEWLRGYVDLRPGAPGSAGDSSMSGGTDIIPGRPQDPDRTAVFDDPDLPSETLILEPFIPPPAGLLDMPFDLRRLIEGDPLPVTFWRTGTPYGLGVREPRPFQVVPTPAASALPDAPPATPPRAAVVQDEVQAPVSGLDSDTTIVGGPRVGTIVHFVPEQVVGRAPQVPPAWVPFVVKMFPIGCRFLPDATPDCSVPTYVFVLQYPPGSASAIGTVLPATPGYVFGEGDESRTVQVADPYLGSRGSWGQPYDDQWALKQIGLGSAAASGKAGAAVTVAVIDTGVAWNHKDFGPGNLWINPGERPANGRDDDGNGYVDDIVGWNFVDRNNLPWDFNGHGTLVAGIIAAERDKGIGIAGVNPRARVMVLKAMDERGRGSASTIAEAIVYAASNGARVINLSVGGRRLTRTEYLAIEFAHSRGAVVVVAAGNEGIDLDDYGPGGVPRALTVTATDTADRRVKESNFGADIDLAAPGVDVLGPRAIGTDLLAAAGARNYRRGDNAVGPDAGYMRATGTSFAAPLVAGAASLLFAANPSLSAAQVERMLLHSARDIEAPGVDHLSGYGRLDATAAMAADPAFFVDSAIARVEVAQSSSGPVARLIGVADADRYAGAKIEIGAGEHPSSWKPVAGGPARPVRDGVLAEIPAAAFQGSSVWTLRVVTSHANGRAREARYLLRLN